MRVFVAALALCAWACNSTPAGTCTPSTGAVVSAGQAPASCLGSCIQGEDAGPFCLIECTDGGDPLCQVQVPGTACGPVSITPGRDWCLPPCEADTDASACPDPRLTCSADAGVCTL